MAQEIEILPSRRDLEPAPGKHAAGRVSWAKQYTAAALILLYPFFSGLLPAIIGLVAFVIGAALFTWDYVSHRDWWRTNMGWVGFVWLALALFAVITMLFTPHVAWVNPLLFLAAVVLMLLLSTMYGWQKPVFRVIVAFALINALATLLFFFVPDTLHTTVGPRLAEAAQAESTYRSALTLNSGYNAMHISLGLVVLLSPRAKGEWRTKALAWQLPIILILLVALMLTDKRAHLAFPFIVLGVVYLLSLPFKAWWKLLGGFALVGAIAVFALSQIGTAHRVIDRLLATFQSDNLYDATSGRVILWEQAVDGFKESPIIGQGWGSFSFQYESGNRVSIAHNQIFNSLFEGGIVGISLYLVGSLAALVVTFIVGIKLRGRPDTGPVATVVYTSLSLQMFLLLYANTTGELLAKPYTYVPYLLAIGAAYSAKSYLEETAELEEEVTEEEGTVEEKPTEETSELQLWVSQYTNQTGDPHKDFGS